MSYNNFPSDFVSRVLQDDFLGGEKLLIALDQTTPTSIRINDLKQKELDFDLNTEIPWCSNAFYINERPQYTLDPLFHASTYYPQEAGSMFLDTILNELDLPSESKALDLCAAPGGKSTLIANFLRGKGILVSNEVIQSRAKILKENLTKWGANNTIVTNNDPIDFNRISNYFDLIVVDAPCSGEGMFRKDKDARKEWSNANVELCTGRQRRIVMDVWDSLKNGGYLIYSTCTFNSSENEDNIIWFLNELDAELIHINSDLLPRGRNQIGHYGLPTKVDTEGFFIAVLKKRGEQSNTKLALKSKGELLKIKDTNQFSNFCKIEGQAFFQWREYIFAFPEKYTDDIFYLNQHLKTIKLGTEIGEFTRKGWNPKEGLALNPILLSSLTPTLEVQRDEALSYLHGDTFNLPGNQGYYIITYKNQPLGWIKHLGNRFNNLYPKEWRIRMRIDNK